MTSPDLTIAVMTFNEEATVSALIEEFSQALLGETQSFEFLIIDDGSTDATPEICRQIAATTQNVRYVRHDINAGLGQVYRTGFKEAHGRFIAFIPADGQFPPSAVLAMRARAEENDLVLSLIDNSRRGVAAQIMSKCERLLYTCMFGPIPRYQGMALFRREMLEKMSLTSTGRGWVVLFEVIIRAKRSGLRILTVPTDFRPRMAGRSKVMNVAAVINNLRQIVALRVQLSREALTSN